MTDTKPKATAKSKKDPSELSEREYTAMQDDTKAMLDAQPKVNVHLPQVGKHSTDEPWPDVTVAVNGHVYLIKRGESVPVPQTVADILSEADTSHI